MIENKYKNIFRPFQALSKSANIKLEKTSERRTDLSEHESKYIRGILDPNNNSTQTLVASLRDKQIHVIVEYISMLINLKEKSKNVLVDFGCGDTGNLFYNLYQKKSRDFIKKIIYYGLEYNKNLKKSNFNNFKETIDFFGNENKNFKEVFLATNKFVLGVNSGKFQKADYVLLKNVTHEVNLFNIPEMIDNLNNIINIGGYIIIYDMSDFPVGERKNVPFNISEIREIFCKLVGFKEKDYTECPCEDLEGNKLNWTPLFTIMFEKIKNTPNFKKEEIKMFLLNLFSNKSRYYLEKKREADYLISRQQEKGLDYFKNTIYHSNCMEQIDEAKNAWGM
jgi:hypothetical protein